jgi:hypothetical protein
VTDTAIDTRSDIDILMEYEFEPTPETCSFGECPNEATHQIICDCKQGAEAICGEHAEFFRQNPQFELWFNGACGDFTIAEDCTIAPLP